MDPTNADRVFVRMKVSPLDRYPERLLDSEDGGATFASILELHQLRGFAIADDGQAVWAGSAVCDGVWAARGGALDFTQIAALEVRCLAARGDELFVCADQLTGPFALGRSRDAGATYEALLSLDDLSRLPDCPSCSATGAICPAWIDDLQLDWERYLGVDAGPILDASMPLACADAGAAAFDGGARSIDGGRPASVAPPSAGCGCGAAPGRSPAGALALLFALGATARARRRC